MNKSSSFSSSSSLENDHDHALANVKKSGSNNHNHKCDLCKRVFASGNALGGHKTAHRKHILPTKKSYSCRLCNKSFSSIKALNGHMKWHSQKGSKGVVASSLEQTSNYDGQEPAIDLLTYLPPRSYRTKKRCRKIVDDDDEGVTAAQILFDMSHSREVYKG